MRLLSPIILLAPIGFYYTGRLSLNRQCKTTYLYYWIFFIVVFYFFWNKNFPLGIRHLFKRNRFVIIRYAIAKSKIFKFFPGIIKFFHILYV